MLIESMEGNGNSRKSLQNKKGRMKVDLGQDLKDPSIDGIIGRG